jgi:hypothetical protein
VLLSFQSSKDAFEARLDTSGLWVAGGTLWDYASRDIVACFGDGAWKRGGREYRTLTLKGECHLLFGIPRDPHSLSEPIHSLAFVGPTLQVDGLAFAWYQPEVDAWRGIARRITWTSFRVISCDAISAFVDVAGVPHFNPWDSGASDRTGVFPRSPAPLANGESNRHC